MLTKSFLLFQFKSYLSALADVQNFFTITYFSYVCQELLERSVFLLLRVFCLCWIFNIFLKTNFFSWIVNYLLFNSSWMHFLEQKSIVSKEILSFDRKSLPLKGNHFLWQEIISFDRESFPLIGNYFLWREIISFDMKWFLLTGNSFPLTRNKSFWQKHILLDTKQFSCRKYFFFSSSRRY